MAFSARDVVPFTQAPAKLSDLADQAKAKAGDTSSTHCKAGPARCECQPTQASVRCRAGGDMPIR